MRMILISPVFRALLTLVVIITLTGTTLTGCCPDWVIPEKEPPKPVGKPDRMVSISGTIQLQDYETFGDNEHASGNFNKVTFVGSTQPQAIENVPPPKICAGGEIWAALDIKATKVNAAGDVSISVDGRLYEGTSCDTTDLDGNFSNTFTVPAGTTMTKSFSMSNTEEEEPEDKADITLTIENSVAP